MIKIYFCHIFILFLGFTPEGKKEEPEVLTYGKGDIYFSGASRLTVKIFTLNKVFCSRFLVQSFIVNG